MIVLFKLKAPFNHAKIAAIALTAPFVALLPACDPKQEIVEHSSEAKVSASSASSEYRWRKKSHNDHFFVSLSPGPDVSNPIKPPISQYHQWVIRITDKQQKGIDNLSLTLDGGMADHGHGLPSKPLVDSELGEGLYLISGMLFNMLGKWTISVMIQGQSIQDFAEFEIELTY